MQCIMKLKIAVWRGLTDLHRRVSANKKRSFTGLFTSPCVVPTAPEWRNTEDHFTLHNNKAEDLGIKRNDLHV